MGTISWVAPKPEEPGAGEAVTAADDDNEDQRGKKARKMRAGMVPWCGVGVRMCLPEVAVDFG